MFTSLALAMMIAQPSPKENKQRDPKLDSFLANHNPFVAKAVTPDPKDTPLRKLQKERGRARAIAVAMIKEAIQTDKWDPTFYADYIKLQAALWENVAEVLDSPADKLKCYQLRFDAMKEFERFSAVRVANGNDPPQNLPIAKAARIDAEIDLLKAKEAIEKAGKK